MKIVYEDGKKSKKQKQRMEIVEIGEGEESDGVSASEIRVYD